MNCQGMHKFLLVEEWTGMGAHCSCLQCDKTLHMDMNILERYYLPFTHHSGTQGPDGDMEIMVLDKVLK